MQREYVSAKEFSKQLSMETGFTMRDIQYVLENIAPIVYENMEKGKSTKICKDICITFTEQEGWSQNVCGTQRVIKPRKKPWALFSKAFRDSLIKN